MQLIVLTFFFNNVAIFHAFEIIFLAKQSTLYPDFSDRLGFSLPLLVFMQNAKNNIFLNIGL